MTAISLVLPRRSPARTGRAVGAALLWRASDIDVVPVTAQPALFTRNATKSFTDSYGVAGTALLNQPAWTAVDTDADGVRDRASLDMDASSSLTWTAALQRLYATDELTVLVEMNPVWALTGGITGGPGIIALGSTAANSADNLVAMDLFRSASVNTITARLSNGTSTTTQDVALPASASVLTILAQLRVSGGLHGVYLEVNGTNATSALNQNIAGRQWRGSSVVLNNKGNGGGLGTGRYFSAMIVRGRKTLAEMQALR